MMNKTTLKGNACILPDWDIGFDNDGRVDEIASKLNYVNEGINGDG